jgi:pimeloyl-ACP methyl ester carboxylesterase
VRSRHVAFTALVDAPTVTTGEERLYSKLTGDDEGRDSGLAKQEIARRLKEAGPSGFDPVPVISQMSGPGVWLYGARDQSIPSEESATILERMKSSQGKDFTIVMFPNAGHGLLDVPPSDPQALPTLVEWIVLRVRS